MGDTGDAPIQHDFITLLGARIVSLGQPLRYMEVGVSVLKNIYTQSHYFENAQITAVDIEDPNPTVEANWTNKRTLAKWSETSIPDKDMRRQRQRPADYVNQYDGPRGNRMFYVTGDAFNSATWDHLRDSITSRFGPMNLVLSDGLHRSDAVIAE